MIPFGYVYFTFITIRFLNKKAPSTIDDLALRSGLPPGFFLKTLKILKDAGYLYRTDDSPSEYVLSVSPENIRLKDIMDTAIGHINDKELPLVSNKVLWKESIKICTKYRESFTTEANPTLLEIAQNLRTKIR